ncbi:hemolymph lipopolysaccharide-binding protein-like [Copidosoma floridanum]|uniref:hemolymph lipopolysaccharide-binding protein-like n=1 Tax=Copidosoma floridanum TaxID=29053 RepID=UPI0006C9580C|nr:hemolymph lipopolysaccharide-binding protein-like [Copidosoma floridanum]
MDMLNEGASKIRDAANKEQALLGIHDMFQEGEWLTVFGQSIYITGYSNWSPIFFGGQPDNYLGNQNCGSLIKSGGMDDVNCREKFAFFCEAPLIC